MKVTALLGEGGMGKVWRAHLGSEITIPFVTHSIEQAIKVGNGILLLSAYPGTVKAEIRSPGIDETDRTGRVADS